MYIYQIISICYLIIHREGDHLWYYGDPILISISKARKLIQGHKFLHTWDFSVIKTRFELRYEKNIFLIICVLCIVFLAQGVLNWRKMNGILHSIVLYLDTPGNPKTYKIFSNRATISRTVISMSHDFDNNLLKGITYLFWK